LKIKKASVPKQDESRNFRGTTRIRRKCAAHLTALYRAQAAGD